MSRKSNNLRRMAAFAAALSFFAAANLTPTGVLAAEISGAVSKKASVTAKAVPAAYTPQDDQKTAAVTGTTAAQAATTAQQTTTTAQVTTTTVQTTTTPAPKEQSVKLTFSLSFGDLDSLIPNKNNLCQNLSNQLQNMLKEKENQKDKTFYGISVECNKEQDVVKDIVLKYKTYDTAAAQDIIDKAVAGGLTHVESAKYYCQFSVDQSQQKISCEKVFCRWETDTDARVALDHSWADGETVTQNEGKDLYVKYGLKFTEKQFKVDTGYYLELVQDENAGQNQTPPSGITVKDTVRLSKGGISVGSDQIYQVKDCVIRLTVNTDDSVNKTYAPESVKWSELNADQPELKFQATTDDNAGVEIRAENNKKTTIQVKGKDEKAVKLKGLLNELGYSLDTLGKQKETVIKLNMTAMPFL
ncbi:MAG: hypothetical protein J5753_02875, partial [Oscillospiraceae bacterium]|nr:hypothetical protein [Oscillospiraceae bacterium]